MAQKMVLLVEDDPDIRDIVQDVLEAEGYEVRAWPALHHYFGGVSVTGRAGCAGDPRRSGSARVVSPR